MKSIWILLLFLALSWNVYGDEISLKSIGLEAADSAGCYVKNGEEKLPTIGAMVALYGTPGLDNDVIIKIIDSAVKSGCNIHEPDNMGLSPLNAAILFNNSKLVLLLLNYGADPKLIISSSKPQINGLNSYEFAAYLTSKNQNREEISNVLNGH